MIFRTDCRAGRDALAASLRRVARNLGSYQQFSDSYPVTIIPPLPAYPLFEILALETFQDAVFRTLDSRSAAIAHIKATGHLPELALPAEPVLRRTPKAHWCAYEKWQSPQATRSSLQIRPEWSDCRARATLASSAIKALAFVPYSDDPDDPETRGLEFHGYFFEGRAQDHEAAELPGKAVQICVFGQPQVAALEEWNDADGAWRLTWLRPS